MTDFEKKLQEHLKIALEDFNEIQEENDKIVHEFTKLKQDYDELFNKYVQTRTDLVKLEREFNELKKFDELNKTFFELFKIALDKPEKLDELYARLKFIQEDDPTSFTFTREQIAKLKQLPHQGR